MKTLVILSGGMDSTVLAYQLKNASRHDLIGAVSVNYGQKHARELDCAAKTCKALEIKHFLVDLSPVRRLLNNSALTGGWEGPEVPKGHYAAESMKATVVPNRNMILMALAIGVAINNGCQAVAYGAHAGDHAVYPDCRPEFADAMNVAAGLCDYEPVKILRPFITITKADIVRRGLDLGVPFKDTHTCYEGEVVACGRCGTCVERLEAFEEACPMDPNEPYGTTDPLEYRDTQFWRESVKTQDGSTQQTLNMGPTK